MRTSFFSAYGDHRDLHSFPIRRSSDLARIPFSHNGSAEPLPPLRPSRGRNQSLQDEALLEPSLRSSGSYYPPGPPRSYRSEEHTSELQSRRDLVCRLLLEKNNISPRLN